MLSLTAASAAASFTICAALLTYLTLKSSSPALTSAARGYILQNKVTHARFSPASAHHVFSYPTLFILVSLNALESHSLDLGRGWLFGYNQMYGKLTGLRPSAYLMECGGGDIRTKLKNLLDQRGYDAKKLEDAWMLTMPGYLGFEGINPLTVYFLYDSNNEAWAVLLEVCSLKIRMSLYLMATQDTQHLR